MALQPNSLLEDHLGGTGDLNGIVNGNWTKLNNYINPGAGMTARLDDDSPPGVGSIINASGDIFIAADIGATVFFLTDRQNFTLTGVTSATKATIAPATGELSAQPFQLYRLGEVERTALARGLSKRAQLGSAFDKMLLRYDNAHTRFNFENVPGYNLTAGRILFGGGTNADLATSADLVWDDSTKLLTANGKILAKNYHHTHGTIGSNANIQIDFQLEELRSINTLGTNTTFTSANLAAGRKQIIRIVADGTPRNLTFPGGWVFIGAAAPANIAGSKTGLLRLWAFGTTDADVVAKWDVQP